MTDSSLEDHVAELRRDLRLLRSTVTDMQEEYARELRTQRVTVVDADGIQRVTLAGEHQTGSVLVRLGGEHERDDGAELYASEDPEGGQPEVGLCLIRGGNIVSTWRSGVPS